MIDPSLHRRRGFAQALLPCTVGQNRCRSLEELLEADHRSTPGDVEDDASSTKRRSLLSPAGSLLAEISLPKLAVAWFLLIVGPGLVSAGRPARERANGGAGEGEGF